MDIRLRYYDHNKKKMIYKDLHRRDRHEDDHRCNVMLSTLATDKEGREVYRGDIIERLGRYPSKKGTIESKHNLHKGKEIIYSTPHPSQLFPDRQMNYYRTGNYEEVIYDKECGYMPLQDNDTEFGRPVDHDKFRVVGNIYENADLLDK